MNGVLFSWSQYFLIKSSKWRNLFENNFSVQFNHRLFAYLTYSLCACTSPQLYLDIFYASRNSSLLRQNRRAGVLLFVLVNA